MNYFTDGYKKSLELQNLELIGRQSSKLCSFNISDLFAQASSCGYLDQADRYQLILALLTSQLTEEEQAAIDRLLYAIGRGRIRLTEEDVAEVPQAPLSQPEPQLSLENCPNSPATQLSNSVAPLHYPNSLATQLSSSVAPLPRLHYFDLPQSWHSMGVIREIA